MEEDDQVWLEGVAGGFSFGHIIPFLRGTVYLCTEVRRASTIRPRLE